MLGTSTPPCPYTRDTNSCFLNQLLCWWYNPALVVLTSPTSPRSTQWSHVHRVQRCTAPHKSRHAFLYPPHNSSVHLTTTQVQRTGMITKSMECEVGRQPQKTPHFYIHFYTRSCSAHILYYYSTSSTSPPHVPQPTVRQSAWICKSAMVCDSEPISWKKQLIYIKQAEPPEVASGHWPEYRCRLWKDSAFFLRTRSGVKNM